MIEGSSISLRAFSSQHLENTRAWVNDPEIMRLLDRGKLVDEAEHQEWFASLANKTDCKYFAIVTNDGGRHIGNVWLHAIDLRHRKAELRVMIGDLQCAGHGMGTEAITLLVRYAFENLNLHKVYAFVLGFNPRALRAFQKSGFEIEGTLREDRWAGDHYTDVYLLGTIRESDDACDNASAKSVERQSARV